MTKLVVLKSSILDGLDIGFIGAFGDVSVVISDHLVEEGLSIVGGGDSHAVGLDDFDNGNALVVKLFLDLFLVFSKGIVELLVLGILLDGGNSSNCSSLGTNLVFESNRKEVSFFGGEVFVLGLDNLLQIRDHVIKSLCLFSHSSHESVFFQTHFDFI